MTDRKGKRRKKNQRGTLSPIMAVIGSNPEVRRAILRGGLRMWRGCRGRGQVGDIGVLKVRDGRSGKETKEGSERVEGVMVFMGGERWVWREKHGREGVELWWMRKKGGRERAKTIGEEEGGG